MTRIECPFLVVFSRYKDFDENGNLALVYGVVDSMEIS